MKTYAYGYPRIGDNREYKKEIERFWKGECSEIELDAHLNSLHTRTLQRYRTLVNNFPCAEMTRYDFMLDTAIMLGVYRPDSTRGYYDLCRGPDALDMTKWFNTNYHYLVPDLSAISPENLTLHWNKAAEMLTAAGTGIASVIGPFTFLKLAKGIQPGLFNDYLEAAALVYRQIVRSVPELHIDEPALVLDTSSSERSALLKAYATIGESGSHLHLFTYYDSVDFLTDLYDLPFTSIGLDFVRGGRNLETVLADGFPEDKILVAGVVDGRNVWRTDIEAAVALLKKLSGKVRQLQISNAGPLFHLPISTENQGLDTRLLNRLAFANERLTELGLIADAYDGSLLNGWNTTPESYGENELVKRRVRELGPKDFVKEVPYARRSVLQQNQLRLPLFPTTTIGSFPQTAEVRSVRTAFRNKKISAQEYDEFIHAKILELIRLQEEIGLDVLVHGEFERTDMVEFFAERLDGIARSGNGWVLSYGTRAYRPPIIFGDVFRPAPMTINEIAFAQSKTDKPVKGMLTGPITIISWSFVRNDVPIETVAYQLALALQDEIRDYEQAGIRIVQVDEPAIRERAPVKRLDWPGYFDWATKAFNLATRSNPETQIHTHICYSEFGEIMEQIARLDFDCISIEASRSKGDIIESFANFKFDRQIGLGVWDIHSPAVPSIDRMRSVVKRAAEVLSKEQLWVNPDCGLKTRGWEETIESLKNMVDAAAKLREE